MLSCEYITNFLLKSHMFIYYVVITNNFADGILWRELLISIKLKFIKSLQTFRPNGNGICCTI
jgi:hypothetical protein